MYAVIKTGGKQYRVNQGDKLKIEKIAGDVGANVVLDQILTVVDGDNVTIGSPIVRGASVTATVVSHGRHDKVQFLKCVVENTTANLRATDKALLRFKSIKYQLNNLRINHGT